MKFQDDISNMNTYIHTYIRTYRHTDKPKPICPPHFFKVGGITRGINRGYSIFLLNMTFISSSEVENIYFISGEATNEIYIFSLHE